MAAAQAELLAVAPGAAFAAALAAFSLPPGDSKPDLLHWLPLLNKLDELLEALASRKDVKLVGEEESPFPTEEALAALRVTTLLLDGSHNRQLYGSAEVCGPGRPAGCLSGQVPRHCLLTPRPPHLSTSPCCWPRTRLRWWRRR